MNETAPQQPQDMWPDDEPNQAPQPQPIHNSAPPTPASPSTPPGLQPPAKSKALGWAIGAAVLVIATGVSAYYVLNKTTDNNIQEEQPIEEPEVQNQAPTDEIKWQSRQSITTLKLLDANNPETFRPQDTRYYKVGTFDSGKYSGADLVVFTMPPYGPAFSDYFYRLVKMPDGKLILLSKDSTELFEGDGLDRSRFTVDEEYEIATLKYPLRLENPVDSNQPLQAEYPELNVWFEIAKLKKAFNDPVWGDVYTTAATPTAFNPASPGMFEGNGFYIEAPDGTTRFYRPKPAFVGTNNIPDVTWNDNQKNQEEFNYAEVGGCGITNFASVVPVSVNADLEKMGKTSTGDDVWVAKNGTQNTYLRAHHQNLNPQIPFDEYIARHNMFFWKDFLGRTIKFQNVKIQPLAECGKPVIYLYPEKPTKVSVQVAPQGGFSFTEPAYNSGWNVLANPDGSLKELVTGKIYPYLFWEGKGSLYFTPKKGFVVAQREVDNFLEEKLTKYGLNQKEIWDFKEYWLPRMQGSPYYFVSFYGNDVMDQIAPLTISPKPDTVIRVLMDFSPLQKPISVEGYNIPTPLRKGFTVVEWGGVIK